MLSTYINYIDQVMGNPASNIIMPVRKTSFKTMKKKKLPHVTLRGKLSFRLQYTGEREISLITKTSNDRDRIEYLSFVMPVIKLNRF